VKPAVRGFLELNVEQVAPEPDHTVLLLCAAGMRSRSAADDLRRMGYRDVRSIAGRFNAWKAASLPADVHASWVSPSGSDTGRRGCGRGPCGGWTSF
jgi:hypothetical protein